MLRQHDLRKKSNEVCIKARSTPTSLLFKGLVAQSAEVENGLDCLNFLLRRTRSDNEENVENDYFVVH